MHKADFQELRKTLAFQSVTAEAAELRDLLSDTVSVITSTPEGEELAVELSRLKDQGMQILASEEVKDLLDNAGPSLSAGIKFIKSVKDKLSRPEGKLGGAVRRQWVDTPTISCNQEWSTLQILVLVLAGDRLRVILSAILGWKVLLGITVTFTAFAYWLLSSLSKVFKQLEGRG